jgi:hypothetical protein
MAVHRVVVKNNLPAEGAELMCECGWTTTAPALDEAVRLADEHETSGRLGWVGRLAQRQATPLLLALFGIVLATVVLIGFMGPQ